jgi:WD40 repeat protein
MKKSLYSVIALFCFFLVGTGSRAKPLQQTNLEPITAENVTDLQQLRIIGHGAFSAADISPDGETLAVSTTAGVWLYDLNDLTAEPAYLRNGIGFTSDIRFDVTGSYLQVNSYYPDVGGLMTSVWRLGESHDLLEVMDDATLSDDDSHIILSDGSILDPITQETIQLAFPVDEKLTTILPSITIHPRLPLIAVTAAIPVFLRGKEVRVFDLNQNRYVATLQIDDETPYLGFGKMFFSEDGQYLIASVVRSAPPNTTTIYKWAIDDLLENEITRFTAGEIVWERASVNVRDFQLYDDSLIVSSESMETYQRSTEVISLLDGAPRERIDNSYTIVHPLTGDIIALETENEGEWRVINHTAGEILGMLNDFGSVTRNLAFNSDESQMLSIDFSAHLHDTQTWQTIASLNFNDQIGRLIGFQPDGRPIAISAVGRQEVLEKSIDIWDVALGEILYSFPLESVPTIAMSQNSQLLFIATDEDRWLYDISQPALPRLLPLPGSELARTTAFFSPDTRYLTLIEYENQDYLLRLWDLSAETEIARITNRRIMLNPFANNVRWTEDGEIMILCELRNSVAGQLDYQMTLWRLEELLNQKYASPFMTISDGILCRLDSGFRNYIVVPTYDKGVQRWSLGLSADSIRFDESENEWWRVAQFGPDGSVVFGIDYYGEMTAWNSLSEEKLADFTLSSWGVDHMRFIHDGALMVLSASDGTIRLWGVASDG